MASEVPDVLALISACLDASCPDDVRQANESILEAFVQGECESFSVFVDILMDGSNGELCDYACFAMLRRWFEVHLGIIPVSDLGPIVQRISELLFLPRSVVNSIHDLFAKHVRNPSFIPIWQLVLEHSLVVVQTD
jgi:hypothetical protein